MVYAYLLINSLSFCIALWLLYARAHQYNQDLSLLYRLSLVAMLSALIGSRAFHIFWEAPQVYLTNPKQIWRLHEGGFVWYGGFLFAWTTTSLYLWLQLQRNSIEKKIFRHQWCQWLDVFAPSIALGYAIGRLSCWFTGCCYGKIIDPHISSENRYPTQAFAIGWELILVALLLRREHKHRNSHQTQLNGSTFALWLIGHGIGRSIMEHFRDDERGPLLSIATMEISISSLISWALIFTGLLFFIGLQNFKLKGFIIFQHQKRRG